MAWTANCELIEAAGHGSVKRCADGTVQKQTLSAEVRMYEALQSHPLFEPLRRMPLGLPFPMMRGHSHLDDSAGALCTLELEDLTAGMAHPCVMDVKLGAVRCNPDEPQAKLEKCVKDDAKSTAPTMACRVTGVSIAYRVASASSAQDAVHRWRAGKSYGRGLSPQTLLHCFRIFCSRALPCCVTDDTAEQLTAAPDPVLLRRYGAKVAQMDETFAARPEIIAQYAFVSTSLLFVHDLDSPLADVRLIDFARSRPRTEPVYSESTVRFLEGLHNVALALRELSLEH